MKKLFPLLLIFFVFKAYAQDKYIVDYQFFEKDGQNKKNFTLYRDGSKLKIKGPDKYGNQTSMYIFKDENKIYTVSENKNVKMGSKYSGLDCSYVGMAWGVYILDLDKCDFLIKNSTAQGTATVAGKECTIYNIIEQGDLRTDYYIYNNNLMLKRTAPSTTIQATNFNESPVFAPDEFTVPTDVQWLE